MDKGHLRVPTSSAVTVSAQQQAFFWLEVTQQSESRQIVLCWALA